MTNKEPHLWITYAWIDNDEGDFDYLVNMLARAGVHSRYDRIALLPGQLLWEQIAQQITSGDLTGWAYLLTPSSVASRACREELAYALDRSLSEKGTDFPLIGLIHGLSISDVPAPLRVRLCIDLASPDWVEGVRAGVHKQPPKATRADDLLDFKVTFHNKYLGNPSLRAVEFTARFGQIHYWRIAYPAAGPQPVMRGVGPAGGGAPNNVHHDYVEGDEVLNGVSMLYVGSGDAISPSQSAYIVFEDCLPRFIAFGRADHPQYAPKQWRPLIIS